MPKKRFGQNFLVNAHVVKKIVELSGTKEGEVILEIGAGRGILTQALLDKGARVIAFEIDRDLFKELEEKFKGKNVRFIFQDFLKYEGNLEVDRCVSNIPYNITTPIIKKLFEINVGSATLMLQKEYAQRILASPMTKSYGSLTLFVKMRYDVEKLFDVGKGNFFPIPSVNSTVIRLERTDKWISKVYDMNVLENIIRKAFSNRRKMMKNNVRDMGIDEEELMNANISLKSRAEELSLEDYVRLANIHVIWKNRNN